MKKSLHSSPRRIFWRRGVLFGAGLLTGALVLATLNRAIDSLSNFPVAKNARVQTAPFPPPKTRAQGSLAGALAKIDAGTVGAYIARWTQSPQKIAPNVRRQVLIDAGVLARRHPAWQLASALESGAIEPSNPQIARVLASADSENLGQITSFTPWVEQTPRRVTGAVFGDNSSALAGANAEKTAQNRALDRFLSQSAARDAERARGVALLARRALDDAVARAARSTVSPSQVPLLPPDLALELLNLRLQLLRNLARTPAQRDAARQQIRLIEARYNALLQLESQAQAARVRAATLEVPAQLRREGLLQIERERQNAASQNAQTRAAFALETRDQIRRDFAPGAALQITLPPISARPVTAAPRAGNSGAPPFLSPLLSSPPLSAAGARFFETVRQNDASKASLQAHLPRNRAQIAADLRRKARLDAAQWARRYAASLGATWEENAAPSKSNTPATALPDVTQAALRTVFPLQPR